MDVLTKFFSVILTTLFLIRPVSVWAQSNGVPQYIMYQGVINDNSGNPITTAVTLNFNIYPPAGTCYLYQDTQVVTPSSTGIFSVSIGLPGNRTGPATNFVDIFNNDLASLPDSCAGTYSPAAGDTRRLEVIVDAVPLGGMQTMGASAFSINSQQLSGMLASDFIQVNTSAGFQLSQSNINTLFSTANYTELLAVLGGTSSQYMVTSPASSMDLNNQKIVNVATPTVGTDATNKTYVDGQVGGATADTASLSVLAGGDANKVLTWDGAKWVAQVATATDVTKLPLAGGIMSGDISMGGNQVLGAGHITQGAQSTMTLGAYSNAQQATLVAGLVPGNAGATWYNSDTGKLMWWDGTAPALEVADSSAYDGDITEVNTGGSSALSGGATSGAVSLQVLVDSSTIEISSNQLQLTNSGVTANTYGSATQVPQLTVDAKGRVTGVTNTAIIESDPKVQTLSAAEVDQLETIDAVTLSNVQWGYLGAMGAQPLESVTGNHLDNVFSSNGLLTRTGANTYSVITDNSSNWNTAFSWGDHGSAGYALDANKVNKSGDSMSGALTVVGSADAVQVSVQAHSTQTTNVNLFELKNSAGAVTASFRADGAVSAATNLTTKNYVDTQISGSSPVLTVFGRSGTVTATGGDYTATQITNSASGNIIATTVQAALNELDTEKVATTRTITSAAGGGLSGGGDLSSDRSFAIDIPGLTALGASPAPGDTLVVYDASATALKKVTRSELNLSETEVDGFVSNNGYLAASIGNTAGDVMGADSVPNCSASQKLQMSSGAPYNWSCVADVDTGEVNTASNIGGADGEIFKQKNSLDFELKTLADGTGIDVVNNTNTVTINVSSATPQKSANNSYSGSNTWTAGTQDFSAASLRMPSSGSPTPTASGDIAYDTAANEWKVAINGATEKLVYTSGNLTSGQLITGNGSSELSASGYAVSGAGSAGVSAFNNGTATSLSRSDHTHKVYYTMEWFLSGSPSAGVQPQRHGVPLGVTNCSIINSQLTANTVAIGNSTYNIQRCTAAGPSCSTSTNIYSSAKQLNTGTETVLGGVPDTDTLASGDLFRVDMTTVGVNLANVTVTMTYKCENTN